MNVKTTLVFKDYNQESLIVTHKNNEDWKVGVIIEVSMSGVVVVG
jgi:hypothetical protein